MRKFIVFFVVLMMLLIPSGVVLGQEDASCPSDAGWTCGTFSGNEPTLDAYFIIENKGGVISRIFIDGMIYAQDIEDNKENACFFISGIGTTRVDIIAKCEDMRNIGFFIQPPETATPIASSTATLTLTPVATATQTLTATPIATVTSLATSTSVAPITETLSATNLTVLLVGLSLAIAALITILAVLAYKKHKKH